MAQSTRGLNIPGTGRDTKNSLRPPDSNIRISNTDGCISDVLHQTDRCGRTATLLGKSISTIAYWWERSPEEVQVATARHLNM